MKKHFSPIIISYKTVIIYDQPLFVPLCNTLNTVLPNTSQTQTKYSDSLFFYMNRHKSFSAANLGFVLHRPNTLILQSYST